MPRTSDFRTIVVLAVLLIGTVWVLVDWWQTRKARRVLAESLDRPLRLGEDVSLSAWMHVPERRLDAFSEQIGHEQSSPDATPASTTCPRDGATLAPLLLGSARMSVCPSCSGMWVSKTDLEVFLSSPGVDLNFSLKIPPPPDFQLRPPDVAMRCLCATAPLMKTRRELGVRVDVCAACGATWFDGGELLTVAQNASAANNRQPNTNSIVLFVLRQLIRMVLRP